mgnify:CR=1 FL=1
MIGATVESGKIAITVTTDAEWIGRLLRQYESSGDLGRPLAAQLTNALEQARLQKENGRADAAQKHMEDFLKHLHNEAMQRFVSPAVKRALDSDARSLADVWRR